MPAFEGDKPTITLTPSQVAALGITERPAVGAAMSFLVIASVESSGHQIRPGDVSIMLRLRVDGMTPIEGE
jgi:hypothetical protein